MKERIESSSNEQNEQNEQNQQRIIDYLSEKYDATEKEVIEFLDASEVDLPELSDYIHGGDRVKKFGGLESMTTQRPNGDIEKVIEEYCPTVIQLLEAK